jgi:hypothetical protein
MNIIETLERKRLRLGRCCRVRARRHRHRQRQVVEGERSAFAFESSSPAQPRAQFVIRRADFSGEGVERRSDSPR